MTCALKNDMRNLVNFNTAHKNIKISTMRDVFVQGIQWGAKKNQRGVMCHDNVE